MSIKELKGLPNVQVIQNSLLEKALAEAAKQQEEQTLDLVKRTLLELPATTEIFLKKRREARKSLNAAQKCLADLAKRVAWLNEKNDILPLLALVNPGEFVNVCRTNNTTTYKEAIRITTELKNWTPTSTVTLPVETSEEMAAEPDTSSPATCCKRSCDPSGYDDVDF